MKRNSVPATVWTNPWHFLAFGCGSGAMPVAPGTFGTLFAIPVYLLMEGLAWPVYLAIVVALYVFGVWLCDRVSSDIGEHDHSGIVWDELVGYLLTMMAAPAGWVWIVVGFVLFRIFDIWKPWPINWADQKVSGGQGIMLDDVIAAVYAALVMAGLVSVVAV